MTITLNGTTGITTPTISIDTTGNNYLLGNVGIGTTAPARSLDIQMPSATIGITNTTTNSVMSIDAPTSNVAQIDIAGANDFRINTNSAERMRIGSDGIIEALNPTSGYGLIPATQIYRLDTNGAAFSLSNSSYFGAAAAIVLEASSIYEIDFDLVFLKTTANTVTYNIYANPPPTRMAATLIGSTAAGGIQTAGTPIQGYAGVENNTTASFPATGSLSTSNRHAHRIACRVFTNAATDLRLRVSQGSGTITPQAGSYYRVTKIGPTTGTFTTS